MGVSPLQLRIRSPTQLQMATVDVDQVENSNSTSTVRIRSMDFAAAAVLRVRTTSSEQCPTSNQISLVKMSDVEPLYCAEQIKVPQGLPEILREWTKEVIRAHPNDINAFSAQ